MVFFAVGSVLIYMRNILATEIYKLINNLSTSIMNKPFFYLNINVTNFAIFQIPHKIGISRDREYCLPWAKIKRNTT